MKIQTLLPVAALFVACIFSNCQNDAPASSGETSASPSAPTETGATNAENPAPQMDGAAPSVGNPIAPLPAGTTAATAPTKTAEPPQNAKGVWHYTCSKGCAGGGGAAAPCAKCGTMLAHNASYHGNPDPATTKINPAPTTPGQTTPTTAKPAEPPQNAAGVWHYTCPAGCAGGAGAAVACAKCSKQLEHNKAYHQ